MGCGLFATFYFSYYGQPPSNHWARGGSLLGDGKFSAGQTLDRESISPRLEELTESAQPPTGNALLLSQKFVCIEVTKEKGYMR